MSRIQQNKTSRVKPLRSLNPLFGDKRLERRNPHYKQLTICVSRHVSEHEVINTRGKRTHNTNPLGHDAKNSGHSEAWKPYCLTFKIFFHAPDLSRSVRTRASALLNFSYSWAMHQCNCNCVMVQKKLCHVHRAVTCYLVLISVAPRWTFCQENALSEIYVPMAKPLNMRVRPTSNLQTSILSWISDEFFVSQSAFVGHNNVSLEAFTPVIIIDARFYGCWLINRSFLIWQ